MRVSLWSRGGEVTPSADNGNGFRKKKKKKKKRIKRFHSCLDFRPVESRFSHWGWSRWWKRKCKIVQDAGRYRLMRGEKCGFRAVWLSMLREKWSLCNCHLVAFDPFGRSIWCWFRKFSKGSRRLLQRGVGFVTLYIGLYQFILFVSY